MIRKVTYSCGALLGALAMAIAPGVAQAARSNAPQSAASPNQFICGFYKENGQAYYGHCDEPPPTWVVIHVDYNIFSGIPDTDMCVPPGATRLGYDWQVNNAWWTGRLCS